MSDFYPITKKSITEYSFKTDNGITYNMELKKVNEINLKNNLGFFNFTLEDTNYAFVPDNKTAVTISHFLFCKMIQEAYDGFIFYINNELEPETFSKYRGLKRMNYFKRIMNFANKKYNIETILITNQHFITNPKTYYGDYVGAIINTNTPNYQEIYRIFNKFCYKNSYRKK